MAIDTSGFTSPQADYAGLYKAGDTALRRKEHEEMTAYRKEARQSATSTSLQNFFDKSAYLTGTAYDPEIVKQINSALQQGYELTAKGASTPEIMMVLGPQIQKLSMYSANAKQINQNIKLSTERMKPFKGYNLAAIQDEARKLAMTGPDGQLKDPSMVDPSKDYAMEAVQKFPERTTTDEGWDDFVKDTPMFETNPMESKSFAGVTTKQGYKAVMHPYEDFIRDEKGNIAVDQNGKELGIGVKSDIHKDAEGNVHRVMNKENYDITMRNRPSLYDNIRGKVNQYYKQLGQDAPPEVSKEFDLVARGIAREELEARKHSTFSPVREEKKINAVSKQEAGIPLHYGKEKKEVKKGILD